MKKRRPPWIPVVTALIRKEDHLLLGLRPEGSTLAGIWEFPGGKIEAGESPEEALQRELNEELGIEAEIGELKLTATHQYGDVGILLIFFEVVYWKGSPKAEHHTDLKWVHRNDLSQYKLPEANMKVLPSLLDCLP